MNKYPSVQSLTKRSGPSVRLDLLTEHLGGNLHSGHIYHSHFRTYFPPCPAACKESYKGNSPRMFYQVDGSAFIRKTDLVWKINVFHMSEESFVQLYLNYIWFKWAEKRHFVVFKACWSSISGSHLMHREGRCIEQCLGQRLHSVEFVQHKNTLCYDAHLHARSQSSGAMNWVYFLIYPWTCKRIYSTTNATLYTFYLKILEELL